MTSPDMVWESRQFFENPGNYAELTQAAGGRALLGCIDPRDVVGSETGSYPIAKQTPGGAVGEGLDGALAMTVMAGRLIPVESGIRTDQDLRPESLITAHYRCAFDGAIKDVTAEMADPSDITKENT